MFSNRFVLPLCFLSLAFSLGVRAQQQNPPVRVKQPTQIDFVSRMHQSAIDLKWSETYYNSYQKTKEVDYLSLSAQRCAKAINFLYETRTLLSRTTRFYQQADAKRLEACRFYDILVRKSHLLSPSHYLSDIGRVCDD
jgi:hypothetical protein